MLMGRAVVEAILARRVLCMMYCPVTGSYTTLFWMLAGFSRSMVPVLVSPVPGGSVMGYGNTTCGVSKGVTWALTCATAAQASANTRNKARMCGGRIVEGLIGISVLSCSSV
jgi:hypothetical protein